MKEHYKKILPYIRTEFEYTPIGRYFYTLRSSVLIPDQCFYAAEGFVDKPTQEEIEKIRHEHAACIYKKMCRHKGAIAFILSGVVVK